MMDRPRPRGIASWRVAEDNAASWMRFWGYRDATVTPNGSDAGIDVRSRKAIAQVKYEAHNVGRPALQRLVGSRGRGAEELLFFTGAGYSKAAIEYAHHMPAKQPNEHGKRPRTSGADKPPQPRPNGNTRASGQPDPPAAHPPRRQPQRRSRPTL